jgi:chromosome segregation ATPase
MKAKEKENQLRAKIAALDKRLGEAEARLIKADDALESKAKENLLLEKALRERESQLDEARSRCSKLSALIVNMSAERFGQRL